MMDDQSTSQPGGPDVALFESPPRSIGGILLRLGPGLIVAGSIVGSGELIATTATGAQAGFWLLWLILIGCVIKVFVQVELGRYAITAGKSTMDGLAEVPGPRIPGRGNWLTWYWFLMFMASMAQLGGIVGGVGQALAISYPLTDEGRTYNALAEAETQLIVTHAQLRTMDQPSTAEPSSSAVGSRTSLHQRILDLERRSIEQRISLYQAALEHAAAERVDLLEDRLNKLRQLRTELSRIEPDNIVQHEVLAQLYAVREIQQQLAAAEQALQQNPKRGTAATAQQEKIDQLHADFLREKSAAQKLQQQSNIQLVDAYLAARAIEKPGAPWDDKLWATIVTGITIVILVVGRYGFIQSFATVMVASFTLITILNLLLLQTQPNWSVSLADIFNGMRFRLPPGDTKQAIGTALATFGIIGVGASELVTYPYWCLEKGYARFTGPRDDSQAWADRAIGWMRVMRWDAWCSMVVYTFATLAFYLLGAAVLSRAGLDPKGPEMIRYLSVMYEPVFGQIAQIMFLFGAFAVLYSTFFVANASQARVLSDVLRVLSFAKSGEQAYRWRVRLFSGLLPLLCLSFYWTGAEPQALVLLSGLMQAMMLPMLAAAALFFRYRRCDPRIEPGRVWDALLWVSAIGMLITGGWAAWTKVVVPLVGL